MSHSSRTRRGGGYTTKHKLRVSRPSVFAFVVVLLAVAMGLAVQVTPAAAQTIDWNDGGLAGESSNNPTTLQFGPDGRLYVGQKDGTIYAYTIERNGPGDYAVVSTETMNQVKGIQNHNDNGTTNGNNDRQVTGLVVGGTASNPILYVSSSDPRIGAGGGGNDLGLDTNSGVVSQLTCTGGIVNDACSQWEKIDIIRGLPRSEENHATNGLQWDTDTNILYLAVGGHANAGAPSNNFAFTSDYAYSAAIVAIDLTAVLALETKQDSVSGQDYKYDLPTLDDPSRPNVNGIDDPDIDGYDGIDPGDPFGGNDGLNQAKITPESEQYIWIHSAGYRNLYDIVLTENGRMYGIDNGANANWGGHPDREADWPTDSNGYREDIYGTDPTDAPLPGDCTNDYVDNEPGSVNVGGTALEVGPGKDDKVNNKNGLHYIRPLAAHDPGTLPSTQIAYYGGHPVPTRGNPDGAGLYTKGEHTQQFNDLNGNGVQDQGESSIGSDAFWRSQKLDPSDLDFKTRSLPVDWPPVYYANPLECDFRNSGQDDDAIANYGPSTNGITEYTASNFNDAFKGDLLAAGFSGSAPIYHIILNENGDVVTNCPTPQFNGSSTLGNCNQTLFSGFGSQPLDITAQGDFDTFPGTVWAAVYGPDTIYVFEPGDYAGGVIGECTGADDPNLDEDNDGFSNADEIDNATDPCNGADKPVDFDGDLVSDLNDNDDDGDGIDDENDHFALDANNGFNQTWFDSNTNQEVPALPFFSEFFNGDISPTLFDIGFTGLMTNGSTNYMDQYLAVDDPNDASRQRVVMGGTAGIATISTVSAGDAWQGSNNQENAFQLGVPVNTDVGEFTVETQMNGPFFDGNNPVNFQSQGVFLGTGDQNNYVKFVLTNNNGSPGFQIAFESNGATISQSKQTVSALSNLNGLDGIKLYLVVDPAAGTVQAQYNVIDNGVDGPLFNFGSAINVSGNVLAAIQGTYQNQGQPSALAVGIISTSTGTSAPEFGASWDYFAVTPSNIPEIDIVVDPVNPQSNIEGQTVSVAVDASGGNNALTYEASGLPGGLSIDEDSGVISGTIADGAAANSPYSVDVTVDDSDDTTDDTVTVSFDWTVTEGFVVDPNAVLYRVNTGGGQVDAIDGGPAWESDNNGSASDYFVAGSNNFYNGNSGSAHPGDIVTDNLNASYVPTVIFNTERWDAAAAPEMLYSFPVSAGSEVKVRLFFAELFGDADTSGFRVFDVSIEGSVPAELTGIDPFGTAGAKGAFLVEYTVTVNDGALDIAFIHDVENPAVKGIEVIEVSPGTGENPITVDAIPDQTNVEGDAPDVDVSASGGNPAGTLVYTAIGLPPGIELEDTQGDLFGTIADGAAANSPYNVEITVDDGDDNSDDAVTINFTWTVNEALVFVPGEIVYRVNNGGAEIAAFDGGIPWSADQADEDNANSQANGGPANFGNNSPYLFIDPTVNQMDTTFGSNFTGTNTTNENGDLFDTERYNNKVGTTDNMQWDFPVANGDYIVNLYFAETWTGAQTAGVRVFDVEIEGVIPPSLDNFDIVATGGWNTTVVASHTTTVSDGNLDLNFIKVVQNPAIKAIEIIASDDVVVENVAPSVDVGDDTGVVLPAPLALDAIVSDDGLPNDTLTLSWSVTSGDANNVNFSDSTIADPIVQFAISGQYELTLTADDGDLTTSDSLTVTVEDVLSDDPNLPPTVDAGLDTTVTLPDTLTLDATVTDDGKPNGTLTLLWEVIGTTGPNPTFDDDTIEDPTLTFNGAGTFILQLTANDGQFAITDTVTITVEEEAVVLVDPANYSLNVTDSGEDGTLEADFSWMAMSEGSFEVNVTASDGVNTVTETFMVEVTETQTAQSISFSVGRIGGTFDFQQQNDNLPPVITVLDDQTVNLGDTVNSLIQITDPENQPVTADLEIVVLDENAAPVINSVADVTVTEGDPVTATATATDADGNDLMFMIEIVDDSDSSVIPAEDYTFTYADGTADLTWNNAPVGNYTATVTVTDSVNAFQSTSFAITVEQAVVVVPGTVLHRINVGGPQLDAADDSEPVWAQDQNGGNNSPFRISGSNNIYTSNSGSALDGPLVMDDPSLDQTPAVPEALFNTERFDFAPAPPMVWEFPIPAGTQVEVRLFFAELFSGNNNTGPMTVGIRIFDVAVEGTVPPSMDAIDPFAIAGPKGAFVRTVQTTVSEDGVLDIEFIHVAENPALKGIEIVTLDTQVVNEPPSVDAGVDQTITLPTNQVALDATVTDDGLPEDGTLTFLWEATGLNSEGVTFDDTTIEDATATFDAAGVYTLQLTASDGDLSNTDTVTITVEDSVIVTNDPPVIAEITDQTVEMGTPLTIDVAVTDADGDALTFGISSVPESSFTTLTPVENSTGNYTVSLEFNPMHSDMGDYTFTLIANDANNPDVGESFELTVTMPPVVIEPCEGAVVAINAGGVAYTSLGGVQFLADNNNNVNPDFSAAGNAYNPGFISNVDILNTEDDTIYKSERYGGKDGNNVPTYTIGTLADGTTPLPAGDYIVELHFAEIYHGFANPSPDAEIGLRIFDVSVNGTLVLDNFDPLNPAAGGVETPATAIVKNFPVTVANAGDPITVSYTALGGADNGKLSALCIVPAPEVERTITMLSPADGATFTTEDIITVEWTSTTPLDSGGAGVEDHIHVQMVDENDNEVYYQGSLNLIGTDTIDIASESIPAGIYTLNVTMATWDHTEYLDTRVSQTLTITETVVENVAPSVDVGDDTGVVLPAPLALDAIVSDDGLPNDTLTLSWSVTSGDANNVNFSDSTIADPIVQFAISGQYELTLTADDGDLTTSDSLTVTVEDVLSDDPNLPPTVDAGLDATVTLPDTLTLDATVMDDGKPNGTLTLLWEVIGTTGPNPTFNDDTIEDPTLTFNGSGTFILQLTANDGQFTTTDTVTITVEDVLSDDPNVAPTVDAGLDATVTLPDTLTLDATVMDDGKPNDTLTLLWEVIGTTGPNPTFNDDTIEDPTLTFTESGTFILQLTASDGEFSTTDTVTITVEDAVVGGPVLTVDKTDSIDPVPFGSNLIYTITVENTGDEAATNVVIQDTLPANTTKVTSPVSCATDGNMLTCTVGTIEAGASASIDIEVSVNESLASYTVSKTRTSPFSSIVTIVEPVPADVFVSSDPGPTTCNYNATAEQLTCTFTQVPLGETRTVDVFYIALEQPTQISNTALVTADNAADAEDTEITQIGEPLVNNPPVINDPGTQTSVEGEAITMLPIVATDGEDDGYDQTLTYEVTGLPTGLTMDTATGEITGTPEVGTHSETPYSVTVTVTDSGLFENGNTAAASSQMTFDWTINPPPSAELVVTKDGSVDTVQFGETLTYTITVENTGDLDATNVVATDTLPANTTFAGSTDGCTEDAGVVTCDFGTVAAGATATATFDVNVVADGETYSATLTRTSPFSSTVTLIELISSDVEFVSSDPGEPVCSFSDDTNLLTCIFENVELNETVGVDITVINADQPTQLSNTVVVSADGLENVEATEITAIGQPLVNNPPTIDPIADITVTEGEVVSVTVTATDEDEVDDTVVLSIVVTDDSDDSEVAGYTFVDGVFNWTDAAVGSYTAVVSATDGVNDPVTETFAITVNEADPVDSLGTATVTVNNGSNSLFASTYNGGTFVITNTGAVDIVSVSIDLSTALLPDVVFDPSDGTPAGDTAGKCVQPVSGGTATGVALGDACVTPFDAPRDNGYDVLALDFTDFNGGESFVFNVDIDPTTIQGDITSGNAGAVSGFELSGAIVTVEFTDGTLVTSLFEQGNNGGSEAIVVAPIPTPAPVLTVDGVVAPAVVNDPNQTIIITGAPGAAFTLVRADARLHLDGGGGGFDIDPFEANEVLAKQVYTGTIGETGTATVDVVLTQTASPGGSNSGPNGGLNHFIAVIDGENTVHSVASNVVVLEYDPNFVPATLSLSVDPTEAQATEGSTQTIPGTYTVTESNATLPLDLSVASDALWLTINNDGTFTIDPTGQTEGEYIATLTASAAGYAEATATVTLTIESSDFTGNAQALVEINPGGGLGASTFSGSSFQITNQSDQGVTITSVEIDLSTGILPDMVFDPVGAGGDATSSCLTPNDGAGPTGFIAPSDPCVNPFSVPRNGGSDVLTVNFGDFGTGESFLFTTDIDPNNIQGVPGAGNAGAVSGYELIGATVTVTFSDGTNTKTVVSNLYEDGSLGGGQAVVSDDVPAAPTLAFQGITPSKGLVDNDSDTAIVNNLNQTAIVSGTPGDNVSLLLMDSRLFIASGDPAFDVATSELPFYANEAMSGKTLYSGVIPGDGTLEIPVQMLVTLGGNNPDGGINRFIAVTSNGAYAVDQAVSQTSNVFVLSYDPNFVPPTLSLSVDPTEAQATEGDTQTIPGTYTVTESNATLPNDLSVSSDATWLTVNDDGTFTIDPTGQTEGEYTATVTASAAGYADATATVTLTIEAAQQTTGIASLAVNPGGSLNASTFGNNSYQIANLGDQDITQVTIDLSTTLFPDIVFDPSDGTPAGDSGAKCMTTGNGGNTAAEVGITIPANGGNGTDPDCTTPFSNPNENGYYTLTLNFTDFNGGESYNFGLDVDPTSIQGDQSTGDAGSVSGLELTGATVTVTFADGATLTTSLFGDGSNGGSAAYVANGAPVTPTIAVAGIPQTPAVVNQAQQTINVTGTPNTTVTLLHVDARLYIDAGGGGFDVEAFEANEALFVDYIEVTLDGSGQANVPVTLLQTASPNAGPDGGLNHFIAVTEGTGTQNSQTSNLIVLEFDPDVDLEPTALVITPPTATYTLTEGDTTTGSYTITDDLGGAVAGVNVAADQTWITNVTETGYTVDTTGLDAGQTYTATITASATDLTSATHTVSLTVNAVSANNPAATILIKDGLQSYNDVSTFSDNSIQVVNTGDVDITSVFFDVTTTYMPDVVFDPGGTAGDTAAKCFDAEFNANPNNASDVGLVTAHGACGTPPFSLPNNTANASANGQDGYFGMTIEFNDFNNGETFGFAVDMDPNSIKGDNTAGGPGGISGMEMIGGEITVTFSDGTVLTAPIWLDGGQSNAGGRAIVAQNAPTTAPVINMTGLNTPVVTDQANQTIQITGPANASYTLLQVDGRLHIDPGSANGAWPNGYDIEPFEANESVAKVVYNGSLNGSGVANVPVLLLQTPNPYSSNNSPDGGPGGINHFIAVFDGDNGQTSDTSNVVVVEFDPNGGVENIAPGITNPGNQTTQAGNSVTLQIQASAPEQDQTLTYAATNLPPGLDINPQNGEISGTPSAPAGGTGAFEEQNGYVVVEMESADSLPQNWETINTYSTAFSPNVNNPNSAIGGDFIIWQAGQSFSTPGIATITYPVEIKTAGVYRFQWRNQVGNGTNTTEHNDTWLKIEGDAFYGVQGSTSTVCPKGYNPNENDCQGGSPAGQGASGWFKIFSSGANNWSWSTNTSDSDSHAIYARFDAPGVYNVLVSKRSSSHAIDRFVLFNTAQHGTGEPESTLNNLPESPRSNGSPVDATYNVEVTVTDNGQPNLSSSVAFDWTITADGNGGGDDPTPTPVPTTTPDPSNPLSFTLVNANSDQDIQALSDGSVIDISQPSIPGNALNIRANVNQSVGSVEFALSGTTQHGQTESAAPYALFGDSSGDYNTATFPEGSYTLTATAYSSGGGSGNVIATLTINFTVVDGGVVEPTPTFTNTPTNTPTDEPVEPTPTFTNTPTNTPTDEPVDSPISMTLVNANTDQDIRPFGDGDIIDLANDGNSFNFRGEIGQSIGSMNFILSGPVDSNVTENNPPYAAFGNSGADYSGQTLTVGNYTMTITAYSGGNGGGSVVATTTINFTVVDGDAGGGDDPTPTFTPTFTPTDEPVEPTPTFTPTDEPIEPDGDMTLQLVDATDGDTDLGELTDGMTIDKSEVGNNLSVRADLTGDAINSVVFDLNGPVNQDQTESFVPLALYGDSSGNMNGEDWPAGQYTLIVMGHSSSGGNGNMVEEITVTFTVIEGESQDPDPTPSPTPTNTPEPEPDALISLTLINTITDTEIAPIVDGSVFDLSSPAVPEGELNVDAVADPSIANDVTLVTFELSGVFTHNKGESNAPYAMYGNSGPDYGSGELLVGSYTLTVTAFNGDQILEEVTVEFEVIESGASGSNGAPSTGLRMPDPSLNGETDGAGIPLPPPADQGDDTSERGN